MTIFFEDNALPAAEKTRHHLFAIHEQLERLAEIARQVDGDGRDHTEDSSHLWRGVVQFPEKIWRQLYQAC